MNPSSVRYPLPDEQLPRVFLDSFTLSQCKLQAQQTIDGVLLNRDSWFYKFDDVLAEYKPMYNKHGIRGGARRVTGSRFIQFLGRGELQLTLDDLIYGLRCESTSDQRAIYAQLYQHVCLDGALLEQFEGATRQDQFHSVSLKWVALRSPIKSIVKFRDFITFEFTCSLRDLDNNVVLVEYKKSPSLRPDQIQDHKLDITRGNTYVLNTYHMDPRTGVLVHHSFGYHDAAGNLPIQAALSVTPVMFDRVLNHYGLSDMKAMRYAGVVLDKLAPARPGAFPKCRICQKKFKLTRLKKRCRACGNAVCRDCNTKILLLEEGVQVGSRLGYKRKKFCLRCVLFARETTMTRQLYPESSVRITNRTYSTADSLFARDASSDITNQSDSHESSSSMEDRVMLEQALDLDDLGSNRSSDISQSVFAALQADMDKQQPEEIEKPREPSPTVGSTASTVSSMGPSSDLGLNTSYISESTTPASAMPVYSDPDMLLTMAKMVADQAAMLRTIHEQRKMLLGMSSMSVSSSVRSAETESQSVSESPQFVELLDEDDEDLPPEYSEFSAYKVL